MNNKKQALDKAVEYFDKFVTGVTIRLCDNEYIVSHPKCGEAGRFPFVNLKDGDICIISNNCDIDRTAIYYMGSFWVRWNRETGSCRDEIRDVRVEKKTGVNYFDLIK